MSEALEAFVRFFDSVMGDADRFSNMARGREFQEETLGKIRQLEAAALQIKRQAISACQEDMANRLLAYEQMLRARGAELEMWLALKEDNPGEAWDAVVTAEMAALDAIIAHEVGQDFGGYVKYVNALQQLLFPRMWFFSAGFVSKKSLCSICQSDYADCDHLVGRPYMGAICHRVITRAEMREISLVEEPANKGCRILSLSDGGARRDFMTWRLIPDGSNDVGCGAAALSARRPPQ